MTINMLSNPETGMGEGGVTHTGSRGAAAGILLCARGDCACGWMVRRGSACRPRPVGSPVGMAPGRPASPHCPLSCGWCVDDYAAGRPSGGDLTESGSCWLGRRWCHSTCGTNEGHLVAGNALDSGNVPGRVPGVQGRVLAPPWGLKGAGMGRMVGGVWLRSAVQAQ